MTPRPVLTQRSGRVKETRKLSRRSVRAERRLFLAEGWKAVESAGDSVVEVYATEAAAAEHAALLAQHPVHLVDDGALAALADAVTPQGLVAVCRFIDTPTLPETDVLTVCADVRDPGNAGTVIRTSDAAGAGGVVLAGHSVDPYNPKTVRASVGSLWHLPVVLREDPIQAVSQAQAAGYTVLAADGGGELDLFAADEVLRSTRVAWLFGNEAWGLPDDLAAAADHRVRIPLLGRAESLNLATAAAVTLYATARARRGLTPEPF